MLNLKKVFMLSLMMFFSIAGLAEAKNWWFSPLNGIATGWGGPSTSVLSVRSDGNPSTALRVTAEAVVGVSDLPQWVTFGLTVPKGVIKGVEICYEVAEGDPMSTYISQVRLTEMTTPNQTLVIHDDSTNLTDAGPVCYTSKVKREKIRGTISLALRMVFQNSGDVIKIGSIKLKI